MNKNERGSSDVGFGFIMLGLALLFILVIAVVLSYPLMGGGSFGPTRTLEVTVTNLYVNHFSDESNYMVGTDKGTMEIDNGILLHMWNADQLYGSLKVGARYKIITKGNTIQNFFLQEYPYIVSVKEE